MLFGLPTKQDSLRKDFKLNIIWLTVLYKAVNNINLYLKNDIINNYSWESLEGEKYYKINIMSRV